MSIRFRPFQFSGQEGRPHPPSAIRRTIAALQQLGLGEGGWSWHHDLALTEGACRGASLAQIAHDYDWNAEALRGRWTALKRAACPDQQDFGIWEQETLLTALRRLTTGEAA